MKYTRNFNISPRSFCESTNENRQQLTKFVSPIRNKIIRANHKMQTVLGKSNIEVNNHLDTYVYLNKILFRIKQEYVRDPIKYFRYGTIGNLWLPLPRVRIEGSLVSGLGS